MIERYSRQLMREIWSEQNKYQIWLKLELAVAEGMEKYKIIPRGISSNIRKKSKIRVERIQKIEKKVKHDVIAFLTSISETSGAKGRFLHQGLTSSDVLDTCFNLQLNAWIYTNCKSSQLKKKWLSQIIVFFTPRFEHFLYPQIFFIPRKMALTNCY